MKNVEAVSLSPAVHSELPAALDSTIKESIIPSRPSSPSAESKVFKSNQYTANHIEAENLILEDIKKNKSEHKIIRLSSVFGMPFVNFNKEAFNLIINSLCLQAYKEKKITIGDPSIFRDFIPSKVFNDFEKL